MKTGLTSAEAAKKLKEFGYNELPSAKPRTVWMIALEVIKEPMFILLLSCAQYSYVVRRHRRIMRRLDIPSTVLGVANLARDMYNYSL